MKRTLVFFCIISFAASVVSAASPTTDRRALYNPKQLPVSTAPDIAVALPASTPTPASVAVVAPVISAPTVSQVTPPTEDAILREIYNNKLIERNSLNDEIARLDKEIADCEQKAKNWSIGVGVATAAAVGAGIGIGVQAKKNSDKREALDTIEKQLK